MALTTLTNLKTDLGITGTSQNAKLTRLIGLVGASVRSYCNQYFGGVISSYTAANPTVITCPGHGLETGQTITIRRSGQGSATSINGDRVVTVLTGNTFTVPVNVTTESAAGDEPAGYFTLFYTEFYSGDNRDCLVLRNRPVIEVSSLYLDQTGRFGTGPDAFEADNALLTEGTDYVLARDDDAVAISKSGLVYRINAVWPPISRRDQGLLTRYRVPGQGNIKITYSAGWPVVPPDLTHACHMWIAQASRSAQFGGSLQSESMEGYSYSLGGGAGGSSMAPPGSIVQLLSKYKEWAI